MLFLPVVLALKCIKIFLIFNKHYRVKCGVKYALDNLTSIHYKAEIFGCTRVKTLQY